jgi:hypothetical protein
MRQIERPRAGTIWVMQRTKARIVLMILGRGGGGRIAEALMTRMMKGGLGGEAAHRSMMTGTIVEKRMTGAGMTGAETETEEDTTGEGVEGATDVMMTVPDIDAVLLCTVWICETGAGICCGQWQIFQTCLASMATCHLAPQWRTCRPCSK